MFEGPEYKSYFVLCRELGLEREWQIGDYFIDRLIPNLEILRLQGQVRSFGYEEMDEADEFSVWLPRLDQWLAMLEREGSRDIAIEGRSGDWVWVGQTSGCNPLEGTAPTREEAAARLWVAVTGH